MCLSKRYLDVCSTSPLPDPVSTSIADGMLTPQTLWDALNFNHRIESEIGAENVLVVDRAGWTASGATLEKSILSMFDRSIPS